MVEGPLTKMLLYIIRSVLLISEMEFFCFFFFYEMDEVDEMEIFLYEMEPHKIYITTLYVIASLLLLLLLIIEEQLREMT